MLSFPLSSKKIRIKIQRHHATFHVHVTRVTAAIGYRFRKLTYAIAAVDHMPDSTGDSAMEQTQGVSSLHLEISRLHLMSCPMLQRRREEDSDLQMETLPRAEQASAHGKLPNATSGPTGRRNSDHELTLLCCSEAFACSCHRPTLLLEPSPCLTLVQP